MSQKEIVVRVATDYEPEDGDTFAAVQAALEHFGIPANLVEREVSLGNTQNTDAANTKSEKYYFAKLQERNGEYLYTHPMLFRTDSNPETYLTEIASRFYDNKGGEKKDDGYYFFAGGIFVKPDNCQEISEQFYRQCQELGI